MMAPNELYERLRAALEESDQLARAGETVGYESAYRVLRRAVAAQLYLATQRAGARADAPSAGSAESGGSNLLAATPAQLNEHASGGPPPAVTCEQFIIGPDGFPYGPFEVRDVEVRDGT